MRSALLSVLWVHWCRPLGVFCLVALVLRCVGAVFVPPLRERKPHPPAFAVRFLMRSYLELITPGILCAYSRPVGAAVKFVPSLSLQIGCFFLFTRRITRKDSSYASTVCADNLPSLPSLHLSNILLTKTNHALPKNWPLLFLETTRSLILLAIIFADPVFGAELQRDVIVAH